MVQFIFTRITEEFEPVFKYVNPSVICYAGLINIVLTFSIIGVLVTFVLKKHPPLKINCTIRKSLNDFHEYFKQKNWMLIF